MGRWLAWCMLACFAGPALALSPDLTVSGLKRTHWGTKDGAPGAVFARAQASDGHLWLANADGLYRFDGLRFERYDLPWHEQVSSANVYELFAPPSGGLWIGFTFGGVAHLDQGKLTVYTERDGLPPGSVKAFAMERDGTLWVGTTTGLARLQGQRWHKVEHDMGHPGGDTEGMLVDSAGTLWAVSPNRIHYLLAGEARFRALALHLADDSYPGIAESPTGEVWLSTRSRLQRIRRNANPLRTVAASGQQVLFDRDGSLWSRSEYGGVRRLSRVEGASDMRWSRLKAKSPFYSDDGQTPGPFNLSFLEDREGNIWTTSVKGLSRFSEPRVRRYLQDAPGFNPGWAGFAAADDGALWVTNRSVRPMSLRGDRITRHDDLGDFTCAVRADDGALWFGGRGRLGRWSAGRYRAIGMPAESRGFEVQAIAVTRRGDVWVSIVRRGVFRWKGGAWTAYGGVAGLPELTAVTLATDAADRVWFGYTDGRAAVLEGDQVTTFAGSNRLAVGNVTALFGKRTQQWAGGDFGLAVRDGARFRAVVPADGVALSRVTGIVEGANGELWVNSGAGVVRFSPAETQAMAQHAAHHPHGETYDAADGIEGTSARLRPLPSAVEAADGTLWFLTDAGLYAIDPKRRHRNVVAPPVMIESVVAGDVAHAPVHGLVLPKGTTTLRIRYVGISLTLAEKVRYRYRLEGTDAGWQVAGPRREALYADLRPGTHRFHVKAANGDGLWNDTGATLEFVIPPTFTQTGWFIGACVAGAVLLVWAAVALRVRQAGTRLRDRYEERMAERERIARELHDTLLQGTQGLILRFQSAADGMAPDDPLRTGLGRSLDRAEAMLREGRDRVLDLRVSAEPMGELPEALAATGEEFAQGRETGFHLQVLGTPRPLRPVVMDEAYRVGREALLNAFRHARAARIDVEVDHAEDALCVRVRDDGIGMEAAERAAASGADRWGVRGMHERAARIGGTLAWRPGAQGGTEVELRVPAAAAYVKPTAWRWWGRVHGPRRPAGIHPIE